MATWQDNLARKQIFIPANKPDETVTLKVAAYCRVSTDSDDQLNSFAAQHTHYRSMIMEHEKWEMVEIYKSTIDSTEQLLETLQYGPEMLEDFDEELFCELIERITVQSNTQIHFRLKNGVELPEKIERTVR